MIGKWWAETGIRTNHKSRLAASFCERGQAPAERRNHVTDAKIIGKAVRGGKLCYYLDDGIYQTFSGVLFDHCRYHMKSFKKGPDQICSVFGPTCDALDTISLAEQLPDLDLGDFLYSENIGAYSAASSTHFNGFPPATVVHVNQ